MKVGVWQLTPLIAVSFLGSAHFSGIELLRFFTYFGSWGTVGLLVSASSLMWLTYKLACFLYTHEITSLSDFFQKLFGPLVSPVMTFLFYLLSLGYIALMVSTGARQLGSLLHLPQLAMFLVMGLLIFAAIQLQVQRVSHLLLGCLVLSVCFMVMLLVKQGHIEIPSLAYQSNLWWLIRGLFFVAAHSFISLVILITLIRYAPSKTHLIQSIWLGGSLFTVVALLGHAVLLTYWHDIHSSGEPLPTLGATLFLGSSYVYEAISFLYILLISAIWIIFLSDMTTVRFDLRPQPVYLLYLLVIVCIGILYSAIPLIGLSTQLGYTYVGVVFLLVLIYRLKHA